MPGFNSSRWCIFSRIEPAVFVCVEGCIYTSFRVIQPISKYLFSYIFLQYSLHNLAGTWMIMEIVLQKFRMQSHYLLHLSMYMFIVLCNIQLDISSNTSSLFKVFKVLDIHVHIRNDLWYSNWKIQFHWTNIRNLLSPSKSFRLHTNGIKRERCLWKSH